MLDETPLAASMPEPRAPSPEPRALVAREYERAVEQELSAPTVKWGSALDAGFQLVPDLLLRHQRELKLSSNDLVVLLHLTMAWWEKDRHPFPRTSTIARRMDTSERTVQRSIERLRKARLLHKRAHTDAEGEKRTAFDLSPLAARLQVISQTDPFAIRRRELRAGEAGVHTQPPAQAQ
jgi:DNA replication protein DnaD